MTFYLISDLNEDKVPKLFPGIRSNWEISPVLWENGLVLESSSNSKTWERPTILRRSEWDSNRKWICLRLETQVEHTTNSGAAEKAWPSGCGANKGVYSYTLDLIAWFAGRSVSDLFDEGKAAFKEKWDFPFKSPTKCGESGNCDWSKTLRIARNPQSTRDRRSQELSCKITWNNYRITYLPWTWFLQCRQIILQKPTKQGQFLLNNLSKKRI